MKGLPLTVVVAFIAAALSGCNCRPGVIQPVEQSIHFELIDPQPDSPTRDLPVPVLRFPTAWADGVARKLVVNVVNDGRTTLEVSWHELAAPLSVDSLPTALEPGVTTLTVRFTPHLPTHALQRLEVSAPGVETAVLQVEAVANEVPVCTPSALCLEARFDSTLGKCVETSSADGTNCDDGASKCIVQATCQAGRCVGQSRTCDDGNACTVDVCYPLTGCEFVPAPPCPGDGVCQVGVCNPKTGCELANANDGTACGPMQTCGAAQVCIDGACVIRDPPDGYVCEEASPCTDEGRCVADQCVHAQPPTALRTSWQYDSMDDVDDAGVPEQYHDFVMEPSGEVSLGGFFFSPPLLRANTTQIRAPSGVARRCVLWNGRLVCADYPSQPNGRVTAMDLATGATVWSFDIRTARPDFLLLTTQIFLARLVVQGSDRLAALFESYPRNPSVPGSSQCRSYFLAVIDSMGTLVTAQRVVDPLLDGCNHPHPYGVAADSIGNLYIAFSPTRSQSAPLVPDAPTLLMSYTHDGIFRWKRTDTTIQGGELAIARGLLYPENSTVVLHAPSGEPAFALPSVLGRAVISDTRLIPAPIHRSRELQAFEAGGSGLRWTDTLADGWKFWGEQVRLASWATSRGPRTVALTLISDESGTQHALHGIDVLNGNTAFTCPISIGVRTEPQLMEVGNGTLAIMNGALDSEGNNGCLKCDPPLANSSAAFHVLEVPWISVAHESWVGTFGGAGHDHREE